MRVLAFVLAALMALPAAAQDAKTLADLRAELSQLSADLQGLRRELVASGPAGFAAAGGDSAIDRMNAMEARLTQLTGQTEELQNRINRVVRDGTNRIGDIEFRLCEMEEGCDLGALTTPDLGSQGGGSALPGNDQQGAATPPSHKSTAATAEEKAEFDRAQEVLGQGDFRRAAELFAALAKTHTSGPLTAEALYLRGAALDAAGETAPAAAAWLESFAADPRGERAPESLLGLARLMGDLSHAEESCLFLAELTRRFPGTDSAAEADRRMQAAACAPAVDG
ncbi:MAG: tetratricopeptide repeat protein [Paracoccus sp. (in: a-proteobacteria)]|nr:tetratricopeptide repeat protein [Paracoccus sp. (in: a-proteobacteria)]